MSTMIMNKIRPQRTFSPRTFMGDRGIHMDGLGRVLRDSTAHHHHAGVEEKVVQCPKPWKASCQSPVASRASSSSSSREEDNLFYEAGHEIQSILLQGFNVACQSTTTTTTPLSHALVDDSILSTTSSSSAPATIPGDDNTTGEIDMHFPVFSSSPCFTSPIPMTPPTRSHNPMVLDSSFFLSPSTGQTGLTEERTPAEGAELGLLSVSPPLFFKFGTI
eukprot:TRINITY_DN1477_c0_g2_i1.p1 TRINITY_DN1477_c0_g2~~TRINITY_DN1477_c0_g2_i1.p1  ORF type:complete len:219 (-),score=36.67 TRINITY_DN1477_c0_g2_i1:176-832(-)